MVKNTPIQKLFFLSAMLCFGAIVLINIKDLIFYHLKGFTAQLVPFLVLLLLFTYFLFKKAGNGKIATPCHPVLMGAVIFLISLVTKLIFILVVNTKQYSDYQLFYWVTSEIANETPKYLGQEYFSLWAYQVGFPAIMSPIIRIFGSKILPLIIMNGIFMSATNVLIYLIARQYSSERASVLCSLAFAFFPFSLSLSTVYTNQHLAALFFYSGLYVLIYKKTLSIKRSIAAGLLFALGNMVRPEAIINIFALIGFVILLFPYTKKLRLKNPGINAKNTLLPVLSVVFIYFIGIHMTSQFFVVSGLNPSGLENKFPLYKFVVGLNHSTAGTFSKEDADYLFQTVKSPVQREQAAFRLIGERLSVAPKNLATLLYKKVKTMWSCSSSQYPAFIGQSFDQRVNIFQLSVPLRLMISAFTLVDSIFFILIFSLCALAMFFSFRSDENSMARIILAMLFAVTFFIYLFIEVQHRYGYVVFPALFILSASVPDRLWTKKADRVLEKKP